jgi:hypothetical protein
VVLTTPAEKLPRALVRERGGVIPFQATPAPVAPETLVKKDELATRTDPTTRVEVAVNEPVVLTTPAEKLPRAQVRERGGLWPFKSTPAPAAPETLVKKDEPATRTEPTTRVEVAVNEPVVLTTPAEKLPRALVRERGGAVPLQAPTAPVAPEALAKKDDPAADQKDPGPQTPGGLPLADKSRPDPFNNLKSYVKLPGDSGKPEPPKPGQEPTQEATTVQVKATTPVPPTGPNAPTALVPPSGVQQAVLPAPVAPGAVTPAGLASNSAVPPASQQPAGVQAALPAPTGQPAVSAPMGRQSVLAAQKAARQTAAELQTTAQDAARQAAAATVSSEGGNAFMLPQGPRTPEEAQANAFGAGQTQAQAPAGPGMGQPMMPMQPMYPGQPMQPAYPVQQVAMMGPNGAAPMMPMAAPPMMPPTAGMVPYGGPMVPMAPGCAYPCNPCCPRCPVPCGYANAFTRPGNPSPVPADMYRDHPNNDNAFQSVSNAVLAAPVNSPYQYPQPYGYPQGYGYPYPQGYGYPYPPMVPPQAMGPYAPPPAGYPAPAPAPNGPGTQLASATMGSVPGVDPSVMQAGNQMAVAAPPQGGAYGYTEGMSLPELLSQLSDSLYPSQREWAVDRLTHFDWRVHPQIAEALLLAARDDPAPMVRTASIRALVKIHAGTTYVAQALLKLKSEDKDPQVRQEAEKAIAAFAPGGAAATDAPGK